MTDKLESRAETEELPGPGDLSGPEEQDGNAGDKEIIARIVNPQINRYLVESIPESELRQSAPDQPAPRLPMQVEFAAACVLRAQGMALARKLFEEKRELFPRAELAAWATDMTVSLTRNKAALLSLCKLRCDDEYLLSHSVNAAVLSAAFAMHLGVKREYLPDFVSAGFLHDVGKRFVPVQILHYPGKLSPLQMEEMQAHVLKGQDYLRGWHNVSPIVLDGELDHHECYDGSGYPYGKSEEEISFTGRVLAVVDMYDAMSSKRGYRQPVTPFRALGFMYQERDNRFAPGYPQEFIRLMGVYPPGSFVRLSDGSLALVLEADIQEGLRPQVMRILDESGRYCVPAVLVLGEHEELRVSGTLWKLPALLRQDAEERICRIMTQ